jgi:hypothetical protein
MRKAYKPLLLFPRVAERNLAQCQRLNGMQMIKEPTYLLEPVLEILLAPLVGVVEASGSRLVHLALNHGEELHARSVTGIDLLL